MLIAVGTLGVLAITAAAAWGTNPPGNNGTVRVGGVLDDTKGQESHVGCQFQIEFSGYDEGPLYGMASLELVPPSGSAALYEDSIFIGGMLPEGRTTATRRSRSTSSSRSLQLAWSLKANKGSTSSSRSTPMGRSVPTRSTRPSG